MTSPLRPRLAVPLILLTFLANACGGATTSSETVVSPNGDSLASQNTTESPSTERPRWEDLDRDARMTIMTTAVMPRARELFQGFDAERYAEVGCATCHGAGATDGSFAMPNPAILPLHPTGAPEQRAMVQSHPEMVRFMFNHLLPDIRDLMNADPYDSGTGEGFSCFTCHTHATSADAGEAAE